MVKLILRKLGIIPPAKVIKTPSNLPYYMIRIEAGLLLLACLWLYFFFLHGNIILFVIFLIIPDLSLLGYALKEKTGSVIFNVIHTYSTPAIVGVAALLLDSVLLLQFCIVWIAHIAQDRLRGHGLKYFGKFYGSHIHSL
jgi:hypothetical protein